MEQWRDVNKRWSVSDHGNVKMLTPQGFRVTRGFQSKGYRIVSIDGKHIGVHRLVAKYFLDNHDNKKTVNHKNGVKDDNRLENLEWATYSENNQHAIDTGLKPFKGADHPNAELTLEQVHEIYRLKKEGKRLYQIKGIFDLSYGTLKCIFSGKNWKYEYEKFFGETHKKTGRSGNYQWAAIPEEKVLRIYVLKKEGRRIFEIAKELGLHFHTTKNIFHGKNWKHLYKEHFELSDELYHQRQ